MIVANSSTIEVLTHLAQTCKALCFVSEAKVLQGFRQPVHSLFNERTLEVAYSNQLERCFGCKKVCTFVETLIPAYLCESCAALKPFKVITQMAARNTYHLGTDDISKLAFRKPPTTHANRKLLLEADVEQAALVKFGSEEGLRKRREQSKALSAKILATKWQKSEVASYRRKKQRDLEQIAQYFELHRIEIPENNLELYYNRELIRIEYHLDSFSIVVKHAILDKLQENVRMQLCYWFGIK
jgi:hypothetical protein